MTSVGHPQTNAEAEVMNRTLLQGLKVRIGQAKGLWVEDLYNILWAYHTTQWVPTEEMPFMLAFGTKVVIPLEIELPTLRLEEFDEDSNSFRMRANLDLL